MLRNIIVIALASLATACAGPQLKDTQRIETQALEQAQSSNDSIETVFARVRDTQIEAQKEDLYFYSPNYMNSAEDAMNRAESALDSKQQSLAMTEALKAEAFYQRGLETKPIARQQLSETFAAMDMLRDLGSDRLIPSEFQDIQEDIKDAIGLIEQSRTNEVAQEQAALLEDIQELEIETLNLTYLEPVEAALEKAEDREAEEFAEASYDQAEAAMEKLENLISTQPKQRQQIKVDSQQAVRLAQHAEHIAQAAKPLLKLSTETAEQHVLSIERFLSRIGNALGEQDVTHLPLDSQSIALAQTAEILAKQAKSKLQQQLNQNQTEQENQKLKQRIEELETLIKQSTGNAEDKTSTLQSTKIDDTQVQRSEGSQQPTQDKQPTSETTAPPESNETSTRDTHADQLTAPESVTSTNNRPDNKADE